jgi:hypothetical protein
MQLWSYRACKLSAYPLAVIRRTCGGNHWGRYRPGTAVPAIVPRLPFQLECNPATLISKGQS